MPERINRVMENIKAFWAYLASVGTVGAGIMTLSNLAIVVGIVFTVILGIAQLKAWRAKARYYDALTHKVSDRDS